MIAIGRGGNPSLIGPAENLQPVRGKGTCYNLIMDTPSHRTQWGLWIGIAIAAVALIVCLCVAAMAAAGFYMGLRFMAEATPFAVSTPFYPSPSLPPSARPTYDEVTPLPTVDVTPLPGGPGRGVGSPPLAADLPQRDRTDLARRFLGIEEVTLPPPTTYEVGDVIPFWVSNDDTKITTQVMAELVYVNDVVYMWVEEGVSYDYDALVESADIFSEHTYPTTRSYFGSEASPGIDSDPRLHILHSAQLGSTVLGYYFSPSEYPASIVPYSNEKEIFFIHIYNSPPGDPYYDGVLAHEFQHTIHWNVDRNEESWLNEGLSELATFVNGFGASEATLFFLFNPDLQLNSWPEDGGSGANYGAGFLFTAYFLDRFGADALRALVANPLNGLAGVDDTLRQIEAGATADDVFADWVIANLINDPRAGQGQYAYRSLPNLPSPSYIEGFSVFPVDSGWRQVHQYGTDYIRISGEGEFTIHFEGAQQVRIIPTDTRDTDKNPATDDHAVWWSNRGDDSDTTLTRRVDLRGVERATLEYDVWYWIEELWDYAYLTVSTDGGQRWTILPTRHTTTENPQGNSYGAGYTGASFTQPDADEEGWLHEVVDLSAYAGKEILLRFELITDDAVNRPGLAVDNICIAAINWCDDAESGEADWEAHGFVRHSNLLEQKFVVQIVAPGERGVPQVRRVPLDRNNKGEIRFTLEAGQTATLVVSGLTRYTTEPASYRFSIDVTEPRASAPAP